LSVADINSDFFLGQQEDAHEFHSSVLQKMHSLFVDDGAAVIKALEPADRPRVEDTSLIYQLFGGYQLSHVRCTECGRITENVESFLDLNLDLSSHAASVEEALRNWCKIEVLSKNEGYRCEKCDRAVAVQKQLTICEPPPVLVIHLKRFDMMQGGLKINKSVAFHEELDLNDVGPFFSTSDCCQQLPLTLNDASEQVF
jgi:ubiquitin carboxyl-terminal hydrolase 36/42